MADTASSLELQQKRTLDADTFSRQNPLQVDPNAFAVSQSERLQTQLDAAQTGTKPVEKEAVERYARQNYSFSQRFNQLRTLRSRAMGPNPQIVALEAANRTYTRYLNIFQSELIGNATALEIFVSPWVFLSIFFMRVVGWLVPLRVKGIVIFPPYSLGLSGIGVFIGHLTAALIILTILTIMFIIIMFIVWIVSEDPITQSKLFLDLSTGALQGLWTLFTSF